MGLNFVGGRTSLVDEKNNGYSIEIPKSWYRWAEGSVPGEEKISYSPLPKPKDGMNSKQLIVAITTEKLPNNKIKTVKEYIDFYKGENGGLTIPGPGEIVSETTDFKNQPNLVEIRTIETAANRDWYGLNTKEYRIVGNGKVHDITVRYDTLTPTESKMVYDLINSLVVK